MIRLTSVLEDIHNKKIPGRKAGDLVLRELLVITG